MKNPILPSRTAPWGISKTAGNLVSTNKKSLVKYVEFNITGRCQAGCITCPTPRAYADEKASKTEDDLKNEFKLFQFYLAKLKKLGMEFITIYGREPTLWDQEAIEPNKFLKKIISWLSKDLKVRVCLATSGISLEKSVLKVLFDNQGVLFMKDWGSKRSVDKLIKNKDAYAKIQQSWDLVKRLSKRYKKIRVVAEFLYTGINRADLSAFWENCFKNGFLPFLEVPVIKGSCAKNYKQLKISRERYVRDIYELSLLNLSLRYELNKKKAAKTDIWQPPYGSVFPSPCDKLTSGGGIFLERNGNLSVCCGVDQHLGNINDLDIKSKLQNSALLKRIRLAYDNLEGSCGTCDYSRKFHLCYGCRGNGYTYPNSRQGVFSQDPMCFGKIAQELAQKGRLKKFMHKNHIEKILRYYCHCEEGEARRSNLIKE
jgi:MoaA/NifB/PqqE/SkfB family radical SAM enzyme